MPPSWHMNGRAWASALPDGSRPHLGPLLPPCAAAPSKSGSSLESRPRRPPTSTARSLAPLFHAFTPAAARQDSLSGMLFGPVLLAAVALQHPVLFRTACTSSFRQACSCRNCEILPIVRCRAAQLGAHYVTLRRDSKAMARLQQRAGECFPFSGSPDLLCHSRLPECCLANECRPMPFRLDSHTTAPAISCLS